MSSAYVEEILEFSVARGERVDLTAIIDCGTVNPSYVVSGHGAALSSSRSCITS